MLIRSLTRGDDLHGAGQVVQRGYFALAEYPRDEYYDEFIADIAGRVDDSLVVGAFVDGRIVGCLTYVSSNDSVHAEHDDSDAASFRYFAVDPSAQGGGIGEAMVRWVIERARADGRKRIFIHTLTMMPAATRLYERVGFVRVPEKDECWDGIAGLAYVLTL
ncbi:MAG: GNAT family N-acetyltransferase [Ilumatobacteraceae bacterium]